eukprot:GFUD01132198.1.p2 GENE.GFUD01132198.1~~GFUD01132198.1.p2  ORF type:complete len:151 (+),score=27.07 GFUD01132198.1:283-735(+)
MQYICTQDDGAPRESNIPLLDQDSLHLDIPVVEHLNSLEQPRNPTLEQVNHSDQLTEGEGTSQTPSSPPAELNSIESSGQSKKLPDDSSGQSEHLQEDMELSGGSEYMPDDSNESLGQSEHTLCKSVWDVYIFLLHVASIYIYYKRCLFM